MKDVTGTSSRKQKNDLKFIACKIKDHVKNWIGITNDLIILNMYIYIYICIYIHTAYTYIHFIQNL